MKSISIRTQILALSLALVLIALAAIMIQSVNEIKNSLHSGLEQKGISLCNVVAETAGPGLEFRDSASVSDFVRGVFADSDVVGICICGLEDEHIYLNTKVNIPKHVTEACEVVDAITVTHVDDLCVIATPVVFRGKLVGDMWMVLSEESMLASARSSLLSTAAVSLAVLTLLFFTGYFLSRKIVEPIKTFEIAAREIKRGDMVSAIEVSFLNKDFVSLGSAFNNMRASLESAFEQLEQSRTDLEQQVVSRTAELQCELVERRKAEEAMRESERLLRATVDSTADGILVVDNDGHVVFSNQRFAEIWDLSEELVATGDESKMLAKALQRLEHPDEFAAKVQSLSGSSIADIDTVYFKDSTVLERYSCPLFNGNEMAGRVWSFRDITERKWAEQELRNSEERLETILNTIQAGIVVIDPESHVVVDANPVAIEMIGAPKDEIVGRSCHGFICKQPEGQCPITDLGKCVDKAERQLLKADGGHIPVIKSVAHVNLVGKKYLLESFVDLSERKMAEEQKRKLTEQLEKAKRMESLGILAGGVAHDLNNMLGPLVGYPELLLRKLPEDSPLRKQVQRIGSAARDAADVIQDLLTLARRGRYEMEPTNLNDVVEGYLDSPSFAGLADRHSSVTFHTDLDPTVSPISGSSPHLAKVVMNLIVNACDAMPDGGDIFVEVSETHLESLAFGHNEVTPGQHVMLRVRDTGTGIAPEDIDKIFEPYYSKKKMGASGSGLGLSVVYGVVKDHLGSFDIQSKPGEGTEFALYFPVCETGETKEEVEENQVGGSETILVVDDVSEQRELASDILASLGYQVATAGNGTEAVRYLKQHEADLVLLDMIMEKGYDGLDTYRDIIKIRPDQKAIIVSGFSTTERVEKLQALGAGQHIRKPYTMDTIGRAVREELDKQQVPAV